MIVLFLRVVDLCWLAMEYFSFSYRNMDQWSYHLSKSSTCVDSPWRISPWLIEMWIDDRTISQSRWLVVTRHGWFLLDFWKWGLVILSSVQIVDLWWLSMEDFTLTYRNVDRWSYHPSKSLTCGDSPWMIFPWLMEIWIDDRTICRSRWLVVTSHGVFLLDL